MNVITSYSIHYTKLYDEIFNGASLADALNSSAPQQAPAPAVPAPAAQEPVRES